MKSCCERCAHQLCASKVSIFSNLNRQELIDIIKMTGHRSYKKGETVFMEGEEADTLYLIREGKIKLFKYTKDGKEQILHILSEGDFFGELNLLKKGQYGFYAEAISPAKLCTLTKDKMRNLFTEKPEIGLKVLEVIAERLSKLETLAQNLATNEVETRLAYLLLDLKEKYGRATQSGIEIKLPITKQDMSNYTGVARETISRKLKKLEEEGVIKLIGTKKILIIDEEKLEEYM
ncbi:Crp/Fnr family transcriptional regulator [Clostridiaceae bacterium 35-E11]